MADIAALKQIISMAEHKVSSRQEALAQASALLSVVVGPLATAHRLAELAVEFYELAESEGDSPHA